MKILIDSYMNVTQNRSGGVQVKIFNFYRALKEIGVNVRLFDKWSDKISECDILHIFKFTTESISQILYAKSLGKKVVISTILPTENRYKILIALFLWKLSKKHNSYSLTKLAMDSANLIITESNKESNYISKCFNINENKIKIVANGINLNLSNTNLIYEKIPSLIGKDYLLQVGRFDNNKNQLSVLKAIKNEKIPVVFIGGAPTTKDLYWNKCKSYENENTHFLGWIDNNDPLLASAYINAKAFIIPSFSEIYGNTLMEAGLSNCNLIASKSLPIKDYNLEKYCEIIDPNSIQDIKEKIIKAIKSPRSNNAEYFKYSFSWCAIANKCIAYYKEL